MDEELEAVFKAQEQQISDLTKDLAAVKDRLAHISDLTKDLAAVKDRLAHMEQFQRDRFPDRWADHRPHGDEDHEG
jgi:Tfp pilus assembly protein PilN